MIHLSCVYAQFSTCCRFDDNLRRLRRLEQAFVTFTDSTRACLAKDDSQHECVAPGEAIAPPRQPARATE